MATKFKITQQLIIRTAKIYGPNVTCKSRQVQSRVGDELLQAKDGLLDPKVSFSSSLPSKAIALANKEVEKGMQEPWPIREVR